MAVPAAEVTEVDDGLGPLVTVSTQALHGSRQADTFQLVIPDRMRRGMFWTPRHYLQNVSPLILNRITPVTDDTLPDAPPVVDGPPGPGVPKVTLVKRLGYQGPPVGNSETNEDVPVSEMEYPWDVYYGRLEGSQTNIVVKLSDMDNVPVRAVKGRTQRSAKSDIAEEYHRYAEALAAQGKSLPRYAGLFQRGSLYCAVFQDAGRSLEPEEMEDEAVKYATRAINRSPLTRQTRGLRRV